MVSIVLIAAAIFLEFTRVAGRLYSQLELRSKGIISAPGYLDSLGGKLSKNDENDEKLYKDVTVILSMYLVILCSATPGFSSTPPNFRPSKLRIERRSSVHPHEILRVMLPQIPTAWH